MKRFRWNIGILVMIVGYEVRDRGCLIKKVSQFRLNLGKILLKIGYSFRGKDSSENYFEWMEVER